MVGIAEIKLTKSEIDAAVAVLKSGNLRQGLLGKTRGTNARWDDSNKGG